ncbi:MAG: hypothetical protein CVV52_01090 [Spirochaetae bacterium HGW-Spirochaetae-8]|jgi:TRAP-type C4-dicarboxylate transport system permease small subunit|nr:MAG: hypothetical protein CVV52_01090 [Spirochaetae bacterium HGW-Spirochaetae-8]
MKKKIELDTIIQAIGGVCLISIVVVILLSIIMRAVFNKPLMWSGEVSSILIVWSIYSLFGLNYKESQHFAIDVMDEILPKRMQPGIRVFGDIVTLITLVLLIINSVTAMRLNQSMRTAALQARLSYVYYLPFMLGSISMLIYIVQKYYRLIRKRRERT